MLWVDKHRPTSLSKMSYHKDMAERLAAMAATGDIPHMLFSGPPGAGKKTRVMALLRALFGPGVEKTKLSMRSVKVSSSRTVDVTSVASAFHIEMNPGDAGIYDRVVVQEVIKDIARFEPLSVTLGSGEESKEDGAGDGSGEGSSSGGGGGGGGGRSKPRFKVLVLTEVDQLTRDAQAALRRTMELYMATCRLVLVCESPTRVIEPLRSRCLGVRVGAPTQKEIMDVLDGVGKSEGVRVPPGLAARIARASERNLRRAVLMLEACKVAKTPLEASQPVQTMDWERYIVGMAADILADQSPSSLLRARDKMYELLVNCIPPDVVFNKLVDELTKGAPEVAKHEIASWAAHYEHKSRIGQKPEFHIEAFLAKTMFAIKKEQLRAEAAASAAAAATASSSAAASAAAASASSSS